MTAPPEQVAQKVRQWMAFAEEDLLLARHGLDLGERSPLRLIAYHAQQCAEKCLKAFLVWRQVDFPYTHNIALLLELVATQASWANDLKAASTLTPFAITARYLSEDLDVAWEEATEAIDIAERVHETVRLALESDNLRMTDH